MDYIEAKLSDWQNGLVSNSELLMYTMLYRRRLFEIETEVLQSLTASETKAVEEGMAHLGWPKT